MQSLRSLGPLDLSETPRDETLPPNTPDQMGEWSDGSEGEPLQNVSGLRAQRGRQRRRGSSDRRWQASEGLTPTHEKKASVKGSKTEGPMPADRGMGSGKKNPWRKLLVKS